MLKIHIDRLHVPDDLRWRTTILTVGLKPQLTFSVDPSQKAQVIEALSKVENIEEIYRMKGNLTLVR